MLHAEREFDFPELNKRGVYVIEFIGNGKSSRALVTKGNLRVLEKVGPAGHEFRIVDARSTFSTEITPGTIQYPWLSIFAIIWSISNPPLLSITISSRISDVSNTKAIRRCTSMQYGHGYALDVVSFLPWAI